MTPTPRKRSRGFTLIEILLAMTVAAILLVAIQSVFFGALRLRDTTTNRIEEDLVVQRTLSIVRKDLAGIVVPGSVLLGEFQSVPASELTKDTTQGDRISPDIYTTTGKIDGWNPFSEVQLVSYYLRNEDGGNGSKSLVRVVTRNLLPVQEVAQDEQVLMGDIAEAYLEFYDGTTWTDTWDSTTTSTLPTAIRFVLQKTVPQGQNKSNSAPYELIVPVLVATAASQSSSSSSSSSQ
jgi:type II secretion system protein J